jgi:putative phosphoribosyl transferase
MEWVVPVVLGLPRGGVPVAFEVARALGAPLNLLFVRKIGAPGHPELGIGALVDGAEPQVVMNTAVEQMVAPPPGYVDQQIRQELQEIERRREAYLGQRAPTVLRDRTVLVVDDGVATGGTVRAALQGVKKAGARRVVLAVPIGPADVIQSLRADAEEVVCLATPEPFYAVGLWYGDFAQTTDDEVVGLLAQAERSEPARRPEDRPPA